MIMAAVALGKNRRSIRDASRPRRQSVPLHGLLGDLPIDRGGWPLTAEATETRGATRICNDQLVKASNRRTLGDSAESLPEDRVDSSGLGGLTRLDADRADVRNRTLLEPKSLADALTMLRDEAPLVPMAGCTDLYVVAQLRHA